MELLIKLRFTYLGIRDLSRFGLSCLGPLVLLLSKRYIYKKGQIDTPRPTTHIHDRSFSWFGPGISIKSYCY